MWEGGRGREREREKDRFLPLKRKKKWESVNAKDWVALEFGGIGEEGMVWSLRLATVASVTYLYN